jgi:hypothetical protein
VSTRRLAWLLAVLPPAAILIFILRWGVDVPYSDQFYFLPLLDGRHVGFSDLIEFHNDHRIFFPRLIMLALAHLTGWNVRAELVATWVIGVGIFAVCAWRLRRDDWTPWALPLVSLLIFSFGQQENWLWGWQMQILLNVLGVVTGLALASLPELTPARLAGVIGAGLVASYSFANGFFFWPLVAGVLWLSHRSLKAVALTSLVGLASTLFYFRGYISHRNGIPFLNAGIKGSVEYGLVYLGTPLQPSTHLWIDWNILHWRLVVAMILAVLGSVALLWTAARSRDDLKRMSFALGLAGYAVLSAGLTSFGRSWAGVGQAASGRYVTMSMLLWIALVALAGRLRGWKWALVPVALLAVAGQPPMYQMARKDMDLRAHLRDDLLAGKKESYPVLIVIGDTNRVAEGRAMLQARHLSCFR